MTGDEKPSLGERLAATLAPHGGLQRALGGKVSFTPSDYAAAVGMIRNPLYQMILGARFAEWEFSGEQLRETTIRHSWSRWRDKHRQGNFTVQLNQRIAELAILEWRFSHDRRWKVSDNYRANNLGVGYRRFVNELRPHYLDLLGWLDVETSNAILELAKALRK